VPESKTKERKDTFQKSISAYEQAMKAFHKGDFGKAEELLSAFLEKHPDEKEVVDRARIYLSICLNKKEKETVILKTFDDYYQNGVYKVNQGKFEEAVNLLTKAQKMEPKEGKVPYLMSLVSLQQDNIDEVATHLERAVKLDDYFKTLAQNEIDFDNIKDDKRFKAIVENN
jgi:tetratricopeptide (TPR) repeat protein